MPLTNQPSNTAAEVKPLGRLATRYRAAMEKQSLVKGGVAGGIMDQQQYAGTMKRKADISPLKHEHGTKRLALGNLTNAEASASNIASGATGGGFLKNKTINKLQKPLSQMVQQLTIRNRNNCDGKKQSKADTQSHMYTKPDVNGPEIKGATKILTRAAMRQQQQQQQQQQQAQRTLDHGTAKENVLPSAVNVSEQKLPGPPAPKMTKVFDAKRTNVAISPAKPEPSKKRSERASSPSGKGTSGPAVAMAAGQTANKMKTRLSSEFESDNSLYVTALDFSNEDATGGGAVRASEAASNARAIAAMAKEANAQTKKVTAKVIVITEGPPAGNRKHLDKPDVVAMEVVKSDKSELAIGESCPEKGKQVVDTTVVDSSPRKRTPADVEDFDKANWNDIYQVSHYAQDIFEYLRERESSYIVTDYMERQPYITRFMRSVLIDWMVECQESFELNHETLYLGVKIVDIYLSLVVIQRERLQLVAAAALLIAAKYDERIPPTVDDFIYICDGAYDRPELIKMERTVFQTIGYDLGIPLSYRFLRRYARVNRIPMPILTLARYILETSLMEYNTVLMLDSKLACAALFIALRMNNKPGWNPTLEFYSGYKIADFKDVVISLNMCMMHPKTTLNTVRQKYSHELFYGVAKCPVIPSLEKLFDGAVPADDTVFKMPTAISTTTGGAGSCGQREHSKKGGD
ncbi:G2/mitotic-specific cyclin-B3 [Anopheles aquasalis]|uniref:G2/mitotic-specific cyclin-B3 n=1 Tax=Anopheles aquasalis TaxID=42839 RepID=UPI00215B4E5F|nr:G2/mitotic-specific cyclin-B3 [Anopheles aquasalis]